MTNILLVTPWDQAFGGVASVVGNLATCLTDRGHRVLFLHPGPSSTVRHTTTEWGFEGRAINLRQPYIAEHPVRSVIAFLVTLPITMVRLAALLERERIEVVNVHYPLDSFIYFALCRWLLGARLVVSIHGTDVLSPSSTTRRHSAALRLLLRSADRIVAPSRAFLEQFLQARRALRPRATFIHNGLDFGELQRRAVGARSVPDHAFVLCIASHDEWKGLDVLIRAVARLREEQVPVRLILVGDGPRRARLEALAAELSVAGDIEFAGARTRDDVVGLLHDCTVFVLPSRSEPFGMVVIEALACGKPVLASAVGGIPEIIEDGRTGVLVEPDDPAALARALASLLADPARAAELGRVGRADVERRFSREEMAASYERLFAAVTGG